MYATPEKADGTIGFGTYVFDVSGPAHVITDGDSQVLAVCCCFKLMVMQHAIVFNCVSLSSILLVCDTHKVNTHIVYDILLVCGKHSATTRKLYGVLLVCGNLKVNTHKVYGILLVCGNLKGVLSTSCVIFSCPNLWSISVLTFIK